MLCCNPPNRPPSRTCGHVVAIRCKVDGQHLPHMALQHKHTAPRAAVPDATCKQHAHTQHAHTCRGNTQAGAFSTGQQADSAPMLTQPPEPVTQGDFKLLECRSTYPLQAMPSHRIAPTPPPLHEEKHSRPLTVCIKAHRARQRAVWVEGHTIHRPAVPLLLHEAGPCLNVPQPPRLVVAGCGLQDRTAGRGP